MRRLLLSLLLLAASAAFAEKRVDPASQYPAHATENGVTVAVDPYDRNPKADVFRVDYLRYNFLPMRIIVTNDTAQPISLDDVRILLLPSDGGKINAAEPGDVERRISLGDRTGSTIPIGPLKLHTKGKAADTKVEADFSEHEYSALAVEPHTTRAGFLFYDVQGMGQHPLAGTKIVFRQIKDSGGKEFFAFEIPFDAYLKAAPQ